MARWFRSDTSSNVVKLSSRVGVGRPAPQEEHGRCLTGLTFEETTEFEALEEVPPFDDNGNVGWTFEGEPTTSREKRWLELYRKHEGAVAALISLTKLLG
jgi:hypothetical protein